MAKFARFSATPIPDTAAVVAQHEYDVTDPLLEFDARYGGLELAGAAHDFDGKPIDASWSFDTALGWTIGAAACPHCGAHRRPRGDEAFLDLYGDTLGLTPVAYGPHDDIWYLDRVGRGYVHETCSDVAGPHLYAATPGQLFARLVLTTGCLSRLGTRVDGWHGRRLAEDLGLPALDDATDQSAGWWGRGRLVIGERISLPGEGYPVRLITEVGTGDAATLAEVKARLSASS